MSNSTKIDTIRSKILQAVKDDGRLGLDKSSDKLAYTLYRDTFLELIETPEVQNLPPESYKKWTRLGNKEDFFII